MFFVNSPRFPYPVKILFKMRDLKKKTCVVSKQAHPLVCISGCSYIERTDVARHICDIFSLFEFMCSRLVKKNLNILIMIVTKPISTQSKLLLIFDDANNGYSSNISMYTKNR